MVLDPQNPAFPAVAGEPLPAEVAVPAADIDLPHHPLTQPGRVVGAGHHPHELVAHDAAETVVAFEDLQVGAADPGQRHPDQDLAGAGFGGGQFFQFRGAVEI